MAEKVTKAAAPRKPRAAKPKTEAAANATPKPAAKTKSAPKTTVTSISRKAGASSRVTHQEIALLAHHFWLERGGEHGHDAEDWLRAEQTLLGKAS